MSKAIAHSDDLFESSKMTFGEHLEELRTCLWRAMLGLVVAMSVSLWYGNEVVKFIQLPLKDALGKFYRDQSEVKYKTWLKSQGLDENLPDDIRDRLDKSGMIFDQSYWDRREVLASLGIPPAAATQPVAEATYDGLTSVAMWRKGEDDPRLSTQSTGVAETFMIWLKAGFIAGFVLASPWIFYQVWSFVASGLYPHEKRYVYVFLPFSIFLFLAGAALAFFVVFQYVLGFLFTYNAAMGIDPDPKISEWLGFVMFMPLGFGVSFQLPLVMFFLERIGLMSIQAYVGKWRISVLVIAFLSMILTPAEPISMLLMFFPLTGLFFGGILLCKYMPRQRNPFSE